MNTNHTNRVRWAELLPDEFCDRLRECPVVYLPMGLCEPHGHIAAFGLDTVKADYLCDESARRFGGIVAPTQGYHIHESGYHARWLEEVVGEENPRLGGLPPHVVLHQFLYQLRSFANAGFQAAIVISGHSGGNQEDLRRVANSFMKKFGFPIFVNSDPELVQGQYQGDHAGKYEISQLLYLAPHLVDLKKIHRQFDPGSGGPLAIGSDASESTPEQGKNIIEASLNRMREVVTEFKNSSYRSQSRIDFNEIERLWESHIPELKSWTTFSKKNEQSDVSPNSQWKPYENYLS